MSAVDNPGGVSTGNEAERSIAEENKGNAEIDEHQ